MSRRPTIVRAFGVMPSGREYPAFFLKRGRVLCCRAGPIGLGVPIIVRYRGSRSKALELKERIKSKGFRRITVRRFTKKETV